MNNEAIVINEEALRRAEDELNAFLTNVGALYLYDGIVDSLEGRGYDLNLEVILDQWISMVECLRKQKNKC